MSKSKVANRQMANKDVFGGIFSEKDIPMDSNAKRDILIRNIASGTIPEEVDGEKITPAYARAILYAKNKIKNKSAQEAFASGDMKRIKKITEKYLQTISRD